MNVDTAALRTSGPTRSTPTPTPALALVEALTEALHAAEVSYCHWKSNDALDRSADGRNDLDLLVARADASRAGEVLQRLGFKPALAPPAQRLPGVRDYYGYDACGDRLVHVHLHYRLVVGHDRSKNYRLPLEQPMLDSARRHGLFPVPEPTLDFIVFVIRMTIKYSTWDVVVSGQGRVPDAARREHAFLRPQVDHARLAALLERHLPALSPALFADCARALDPGCGLRRRLSAGRRLQSALRGCARRPMPYDLYEKHRRRLQRGLQRRFGRLPGKRLLNGGAMIAVVGGDGAGKSTAIESLYRWLADDFAVRRCHLGRPPRSWTTSAVRAALRLGRMLSGGPRAARNPVGENDLSLLFWHVCTARDRYRSYLRMRRFSDNGEIVICDRFPLPGVLRMDGPQLSHPTGERHYARPVALLRRLEQRYYRLIAPPDVLLVLKLDPEIAVQRRTDEDPDFVRTRNSEVWQHDWSGTAALVIDAGRPAEQVRARLRTLLWERL